MWGVLDEAHAPHRHERFGGEDARCSLVPVLLDLSL